MSKTLYLMRHGQTLFNSQKKIQGWSDSPLTEKGRAQAAAAKEYFVKNGIEIQSAYSSTSERASDTLEIVTDLPYKRVKGVKEWNFGTMEAEHEYLNPSLPYGSFFVAYGGEDEMDFRERLMGSFEEIMENDDHETVLVVSHGAACHQFMRAWGHKAEVEIDAPLRNCGILKFKYDQKEFSLLEIINHDFLE